MGAPVVLNLWILRAQARPVQNWGDGAVHVALIRRAWSVWSGGDIPVDAWLNTFTTGFPVFHHYQSLPHALMGVVAGAVGPQKAYSWSLYLLLASWPISVYIGGRLMGWSKWEAGTAGFLAPLLVTKTGVFVGGRLAVILGYENGSYTWGGSAGVWTQLWGMWLLPLAWGLSWRAVARKGSYALAAGVNALTLACHFITGYLALASLGAWALAWPPELYRRMARAAIVMVGALLVASWVIVPVLADNRWAGESGYLEGWWRNSFGAGRVLWWLVSGQLFDSQRIPLVTFLIDIGVATCIIRVRNDERARSLLAVWTLSLVLFFGRDVVGWLFALIPGGDEILLSRFVMGVHLGGLYLAGVGGVSLARIGLGVLRHRRSADSDDTRARWLVGAGALVVSVALCAAWLERAGTAAREARDIGDQAAADATDGAAFERLVTMAQEHGPGRIYAGTCGAVDPFVYCSDLTWGYRYRIHAVPGYMAVANAGGEVIGYPFRTGSLLTDVEARFDETRLAQFQMFNVRYLILPQDRAPSVPANLLTADGRHRLWEVSFAGTRSPAEAVAPGQYLEVIHRIGSVETNRKDFGADMAPYLVSPDLEAGVHPQVVLGDERRVALAGGTVTGPAGRVQKEVDDSEHGRFLGQVVVDRGSAVMLKASFHGRWAATVDGRRVKVEMVAPGYPAVAVGPGQHTVEFAYEPFRQYPLLFGVALATLVALSVARSPARVRRALGRAGARSTTDER